MKPDIEHVLRCGHEIDLNFESSIFDRSRLAYMALLARRHHQRLPKRELRCFR